ncbi:MAG: ComEC/Rec2 family competence protein, partial [bacterium]
MGTLPRRPLAGLAMFFIAGTALGLAYPAPSVVFFTATFTSLITGTLLSFASSRFAAEATCLHLVTTLGLGWINASQSAGTSERAIPRILELPTGAMIRGLVTDEPVQVVSRTGKSTWKFPLQVESVRAYGPNRWTPSSGSVRVRLSGTRNDRIPAYGERWSFPGYLAQSTYKQGGLAGKPGALFFSGSAGKGRFIDTGNGSRLMAVCLRGRSWAGEILSEGISDRPAERCILNSILLGYYSQLPRDLYQDFARTGTLHVFAISGSHVVIYLGAVIFILAACGL